MKKNFLWMFVAILICGACVFTACSSSDDDDSNKTNNNLSEKIIGRWIIDEKEGKPALTNQKLVINFESANKVSVSLSYMNFWHSKDLFDYTIDGNP